MTDKSEAERLADELELAWNYSHPSPSMLHAAAELRRQHDEIKCLHEVLEELCRRLGPSYFLEQNWAAPLEVLAQTTGVTKE